MKLETYYRLLLHNEKGELVKDTGKVQSHSYVIQFLELLRCFLMRALGADREATDVAGNETLIYSATGTGNTYGRLDAGAGLDTYGLVVGINTGASPEDNEDYNLDTKIAHSGVGAAGCLNYQAVTLVAPTVSGPNVDFDITRTFLNETGSTITVKEIGAIIKTPSNFHLLLRDVVSDEAVLDGYTLSFVYTLRSTA